MSSPTSRIRGALRKGATTVGVPTRRRAEPNVLPRAAQIQLRLHYSDLVARGAQLPSFADVEFRAYSQNGEDGILWFLFSVLGTTNKRAVEICAGDGIECNSANLILNDGFQALLFDGDEVLVQRGTRFYASHPETRRLPPVFRKEWITRDGVDESVRSAGFVGEIDLFSLDLDGVDWWIWKSLTVVDPRVVVVEYNNRWSADFSVTVPYADDFATAMPGPQGAGWFGASLPAFVKLGHEKGYRLVGANILNTNAVFLRHDVGLDLFPEVTAADCLNSPYALHQQATKYPLIKDLPVETV